MNIIRDENYSKELNMPWKNCIAIGRAYELLNCDLREHLIRLQQEIGYRYCRFHAVFDDDMKVVRRNEQGKLEYNWGNIDKVYDFLLAIGLKPFVELNPMPKALASGTQTMFAYEMNVTPPNNYSEWEELIKKFAIDVTNRYGLKEVESWYFEVWNEPNLSAFWAGSREEYFKLYQYSAKALKFVTKNIKIGGPSTSKANWINEMIDYCKTKKVPLDFISTHLYPQDEFVQCPTPLDSPYKPGDFLRRHLSKF